jgi:hypothetical protein
MAKPRLVVQNTEPEPGPKPDCASTGPRSRKQKKTLTAQEARKKARQRVYKSAGALVDALIEKGGGNHLAVKFLFEFAGLTGAEDGGEESPLLRAYRQQLEKEAQLAESEQTSEGNLNLSNGDCD